MNQNNHKALHVICGSISNVNLQDNTFNIKTKDDYVYGHLTEKTNFAILKRAFLWQDLSFEINIEYEKEINETEQDINKLKNLVGDYLKIIGE